MRESTQSNSPAVTLALQNLHTPAIEISRPAPQLGHAASVLGAPVRATPRMRVQYSVYFRSVRLFPPTTFPALSTV
jgi:hypothetical protein